MWVRQRLPAPSGKCCRPEGELSDSASVPKKLHLRLRSKDKVRPQNMGGGCLRTLPARVVSLSVSDTYSGFNTAGTLTGRSSLASAGMDSHTDARAEAVGESDASSRR